MKISVFGTGYVGLVTGVCFADMGNEVICADVDEAKIQKLKAGICPIFEPGLESLMRKSFSQGRLEFTTDLKQACQNSDFLFIGVGTPSDPSGRADLSSVLSVAKTIGENISSYKVIVNKSTVPVGTQKLVSDEIQSRLKVRGLNFTVDVVSNPEFLREGCAVEECLKPDRIVIGTDSEKAEALLKRLYEPFLKNGNPLLVMSPESSELTKYAANSFLAMKISFMNEMSRLCDKTGADIESIRLGVGSDPRIGSHFLFAGLGYGGSCFPKDVEALDQMGQQMNEELSLVKATRETNKKQRNRFFEKIESSFKGDLKGVKLGVWGVSFKPGTDDIRDAPAIELIEKFLKAGAIVQAYDPEACKNARAYFGLRDNLSFNDSQPYEVLEGADALIIATEWKAFRGPNFEKISGLLKRKIIFDGRNILNPKFVRESGFEYHCLGRP